jgi:hypothetical protein
MDKASLSGEFGFLVPSAFAEFVRILDEQAGGLWQDLSELFTTITGLMFAGEVARYQ